VRGGSPLHQTRPASRRVLSFLEAPGGALETVAVVLNWVTWLAFLVELVIMLSVVPDRKAWQLQALEVAIERMAKRT